MTTAERPHHTLKHFVEPGGLRLIHVVALWNSPWCAVSGSRLSLQGQLGVALCPCPRGGNDCGGHLVCVCWAGSLNHIMDHSLLLVYYCVLRLGSL